MADLSLRQATLVVRIFATRSERTPLSRLRCPSAPLTPCVESLDRARTSGDGFPSILRESVREAPRRDSGTQVGG